MNAEIKALLHRYWITYFRFPGRPIRDFLFAIIIGGGLLIRNFDALGILGLIIFYMTIPFTFLVIVRTMLGEIVSEKASGVKEYLKLNGLGNVTYQLYLLVITSAKTIFFTAFVVGGLLLGNVLTLGSVINKALDEAIYDFVVLYVLCALATISFVLFFSVMFSDPKVSSSVGGVLYVLISLASFAVLSLNSPYATYAVSLFPQAGLTLGLMIKVVGVRGVGDLDHIKMVLILDFFVYLILFMYFDQVVADENGVSKGFFFCLDCKKRRDRRVPRQPDDQQELARGLVNETEGAEEDWSSAVFHERLTGVQNLEKTVQINHLYKNFGSFTAVDDISFSIYSGQIFCLLGHNGAGKTTTIKMLTGLLEIDSGEVMYDGEDFLSNFEEARKKIGICSQNDVLFEKFTVTEHLELIAKLRGIPFFDIPDAVEQAIQRVNLTNERAKYSEELSGGNKRKLSLAMAVLGETKVVFLDEPTSGMDPQNRRVMWHHLKQLKEQGMTILLTTHHLDEADELADRIAIMSKGKLLAVGTSEYFKKNFGVGYHLNLTPNYNEIQVDAFIAGKPGDSSLPQLVQEIQEKLTRGTVECMICYDMVRRSAPVWSCSSCYSIFHLNCIKKWARAPTSVDLSAEKNLGFNWRCPGCQFVQHTSSRDIKYVCFCGKRVDPPSDLYLTPHSCGEPCGKPLEKEVFGTEGRKDELCPHACVLQCHPGPCPPCKAFAPPRLCPCGKKRIATRCSDRQSDLTCGQRCDRLVDCGRHRCENACHVGPCDPCQVLINASCFCSKMEQVLFCGEMAMKGEFKPEGGVFSCGSNCGKELSCGNHICHEACHPGSCGECEFLPSRVKTCCCGKTKLDAERKSCVDPIPTCSQVCGKRLCCGIHNCPEPCHVGDCPPCKVQISQKCRCGSTSRTVECYKTISENQKFTCEKPCGAKKNCGRHRCNEKCCPLSGPNIDLTNADWDPHFCSMLCGKKLRCGQHVCETLCHSGHCPPCLETIFTDLTCACGRTSIPPPLPCGTMPPLCQLPCSVPQPCGHSGSHSCHFGDCPPCSVPVSKECVGGHVILRNIPCGSNNIRCNNPCGRTRQCGLHACGRTCHSPPCDVLPGFVEGYRAPCGQTCGAPRSGCRHMCMAQCHPTFSCPDVRCEFPVTITCSCGRITANVPCDVGGSSSNYNADAVYEASIIQKLPVPLQPVDANGQKVPLGQRKLMCDEECAKLERKRVLADAFDITPSLDALHFGENSSFELLSDTFRRDPKWVLAVEERCKILVLGKSKGTTHGLKVHVFCPMIKDKRDAVRLIAERWKLAVNAAGWEPKRFIVISATQKSKAPVRVLGVKGTTTLNAPLPTAFDPLVDMDPRLVVSFPDLPRDADISALVLRFGGECELVWLNDKNALAVFHDPARAATAMRRLDHGTVYQGAVSFVQNVGASAASSVTNAWGGTKEGGGLSTLRSNPWKKAVVLDPGWKEESWSDEPWGTGGSVNIQPAVLKKEAPIPASTNPWNVLNQESSSSSSFTTVMRSETSGKQTQSSDVSTRVLSSTSGAIGGNKDATEAAEVVDDWEQAFE